MPYRSAIWFALILAACDGAPSVDAGVAPVDAGTDAAPPPPAWAPPEVCDGVTASVGGDTTGEGATVSGHAFSFSISGGRVEGAWVTANEHPGWCVRTDADGAFELRGVPVGSTITLRLHHPDFPLIQTGTHEVPAEGIERLTFQAPTHDIYRLMASVARVRPDPALCQIAATVTAVGLSLYSSEPSHGVAGATVTITPDAGDAVGPIYFEYLGPNMILPDRELTETTRDGGVLYLNVPPGEYVLAAHADGVSFTDARIQCEAGLLVNASPPWSLQAYE